jgi:LmbE family N-acetylglucosaminyl deacetylase
VSTLVFTQGEAAPHNGTSRLAPPTRPFEFEMSSLVLRVTHRLMIDYPDGGLGAVPETERVRQVTDMIQRCSADLLLTAEAATVDPLVIETTCAAGRTAGIPVLAWTLPARVAEEVRAAGGRSVPVHPRTRTDFALRVSRKVQRRAMQAHRSQATVEAAQAARLDVQGDREWLRWLVLPGLPAHIQGR